MQDEGAMNIPDEDDLRLVALLDDQLDEVDAAPLRARLAVDSALRERLDRLRETGSPLRAAFDILLADAPVARLAAGLKLASTAPTVRPWLWRVAAGIAAAAVIFAGGFLTAHRAEREENWRQAVAEYMGLYTPETFGAAASPTLRAELAATGETLGLALDADRLSVGDLAPRRVQILQFDGAPLAQIGYVDSNIPLAFCVIRDGEKDAPLSLANKEGFTTASWAKGGRGFMLIGNLPENRVHALALALRERT
jgi:anti-sigma factor RsiW